MLENRPWNAPLGCLDHFRGFGRPSRPSPSDASHEEEDVSWYRSCSWYRSQSSRIDHLLGPDGSTAPETRLDPFRGGIDWEDRAARRTVERERPLAGVSTDLGRS